MGYLFFPAVITLAFFTTASVEGRQKDRKAQVGGRISATVENICGVISTRMDEEAKNSPNQGAVYRSTWERTLHEVLYLCFLEQFLVAYFSRRASGDWIYGS